MAVRRPSGGGMNLRHLHLHLLLPTEGHDHRSLFLSPRAGFNDSVGVHRAFLCGAARDDEPRDRVPALVVATVDDDLAKVRGGRVGCRERHGERARLAWSEFRPVHVSSM